MSRLGRLLRSADSNAIPRILPFSEKDFDRLYNYWTIWQAVDRKPTEFLAALRIPSYLWNFLVQVDSVFATMNEQKVKREMKKNG